MKINILTVSDLAAMSPENAEQAYRRGYADGYIVGVQDVIAALGLVEPPSAVWQHWQDALTTWVRETSSERVTPPELVSPSEG